MSEPSLEQLLEAELTGGELVIGQIAVRQLDDGSVELMHRSTGVLPAEEFAAACALEIAKFDDAGRYRPLRTAPNLRRGWKIGVANVADLIEVIDAIYPARLAAWRAWKLGRLITTSLRQTLNRQSGMYRVAGKISDEQINELVGSFCRSDGGCLRTISWRRDDTGQITSSKLPPEKFDPAVDQFVTATQPRPATACIPLLCQEACSLLVAACRDVAKSGR